MWTFLTERGAAIAIWLIAMAAQMSGFTNTAIALTLLGAALFFFVAPIAHHAHAWHRRRREAGLTSVEPMHVMAVGLAGLFFFSAIALAGVTWQLARGRLAETRGSLPGQEFQGNPIGFMSFGWAETGSEPYRMGRPVVTAKNVTKNEVQLKALVFTDGNTGRRIETRLRTATNEWISADEAEKIPPGAEFQIQGTLPAHGQPVQVHPAQWMYTPEEISKSWSNLYVHVECDDKKYDVSLKNEINKVMQNFFEMRRRMTPPPPPPGISRKLP